MGFLSAAASGIGGTLAGLIVGYALWGEPMATERAALAKVSSELATTKVWLWDEIQTSDERQQQVSARLTRALADLAAARAALAHMQAVSRAGGNAASPQLLPLTRTDGDASALAAGAARTAPTPSPPIGDDSPGR